MRFATSSSSTVSIADEIVNLFDGRRLGTVRFNPVGAKDAGNDGFGWDQTNVNAHFEFDDIK